MTRLGRPCSICGRPMMCGQKAAHLSCLPVCPQCGALIMPDAKEHHCPKRKDDDDP